VPARTPITGEQTTLPVLAQAKGTGDRRWLKVMLPGRPNGLSGWIEKGGTTERITPWRITVSLRARRVRVYLLGRLRRSFNAVVGKPSTPTPTGKFFVQETVILGAKRAGGPFALALSARSNALSEFDGGPGQIAIHGRDLLGGTLGQAQSHGCMRLATGAIDWLAAHISPGVPVNIY
jgi:lipoprotein-anchoring transpeptidase ErfK/SrfK